MTGPQIKLEFALIKSRETPMKKSQNPTLDSDLPIELAQPAQRALAAAGIRRLEQLTSFTEAEIKQLHGIGPNALNKLRQALAAQGLVYAGEQHTGTKK
jgi:hypothetical protein